MNRPTPGVEYYLDIEIQTEHGKELGKAIGVFPEEGDRWELLDIYCNIALTEKDLSRISVTGFGPIPEDLPESDEVVRVTHEKDPEFENKLGLIIDTMEDMIRQLFGGPEGFREAMQAAGYASFEPLGPLPKFDGMNKIFSSPAEWEGRKVGDLAVKFSAGGSEPEITSIWKSLSPAHRLRFFLDGYLSLTIHSRGMPPVSMISGYYPDAKPFEQ